MQKDFCKLIKTKNSNLDFPERFLRGKKLEA